MKKVFHLFGEYLVQIMLAIDQLANALIPPLDGTISYADETLSARSYRAYRDGKIFGKIFMKPINWLFFWQGPDHCYNAFLKEHARKNMPSEYHSGEIKGGPTHGVKSL